MPIYLHGAYGKINTAGNKVASAAVNAVVYIGTAPVQTVAGGAKNVNRPIVVNNIAEARKYFGYSDNWDKFTLCEAMHTHLVMNAVGPLVLINVLDVEKHTAAESGSVNLTPVNGKVTIANAENIILDSISVTGKTLGTDYVAQYDCAKQVIVLSEVIPGTLGDEALSITYNSVDASKVTTDDVIGETDDAGTNTGLYALKNVYQLTGYIPSFVLAPGFSSMPEVHTAMLQNCRKINNHWDAYVLADLPIVDEKGDSITITNVQAWKKQNGYTSEAETVYYPLAKGTDGHIYHISVLAAANLQTLLYANDGIPYMTASNTECPIIANLYMGEGTENRVYDDQIINEKLNKNGIASAAFMGGGWVIWGGHSADYEFGANTNVNVAETNRMMLFYVSNDFQHRRCRSVDKPMTANDVRTIVAEEQARLDALVKIGALIFAEVHQNAEADAYSDLMQGDLAFWFNLTTTPIAKSLTALVNWTDEGFVTYFNDLIG